MRELTQNEIDTMVVMARAVATRAHAPYSRFQVGAILLGENGVYYAGVNVENSSYPAGHCAERSAVGAAVTAGETRFLAVAVATPLDPPAAPCGMCRQLLAEFGLDLHVIIAGFDPAAGIRQLTLRDLLPSHFDGTLLPE